MNPSLENQGGSARQRATVTTWVDPASIRKHEDKILFILTLIIGAAVGLVVVAFIVLTENLGARMYPAAGAAWRRLAVPVLGALFTGYLLQRYFPNARGSGIPQTKTALFLRDGVIRLRTVVGKFFCSSVSLASGISLGREGPSVQVGAGIASVLGRQLGLTPGIIKSLVPIGASAALAAAFNTPIAAVLFTLEEVMGDLHARVLGAVVLSSATSWLVLHLLLGDEPLFHVPAYQLVHPLEFGIYAVLGILGGLVSISFVKLLLWMRKQFLRMPSWTLWLQPSAGGLLVGAFGWFVPEVLGVGYAHVSRALDGQLTLRLMILLVVLKLIATAACYASGNAGGIFGPSLYIGAMLGGAVGGGAHFILPDYTGSVGAYALVGMGTTFAGIVRVPMTSVIMIFEVTRDYSIIVPLMISNLVSYFISSRLQKEPIYEALVHQDGIHLPVAAKEREELPTVSLGVRSSFMMILATETVDQALSKVKREESAWPVVGDTGLLGMVSLSQLESARSQGNGSIRVGDVFPQLKRELPPTISWLPHVHTDQALDTALRRMAQSELTVLPVVSRANQRELLGVISSSDVFAAYKSAGAERLQGAPEQSSKSPVALLGGVLAVLALVITLIGFLGYSYHRQRAARATQFSQEGNELLAERRYPEAIERFRSALSISQASQERLALATALLKAGRPNEAAIYFNELVRENPGSGPANLGLARIAVTQGNMQQAVVLFHRAVFGTWPEDSPENGTKVRFELIDALGRSGREKQAQAELLSLLPELPDDTATRMQAGGLLLKYKLPTEAADVFKQIIHKEPRNASAYAGLGDAEFMQGNYRVAEAAYKSALLWNPADSNSGGRVADIAQILALDPYIRGLSATERYERSRKLVQAILGAMDQCMSSKSPQVPASVTALADSARKLLLNHRRPRSLSEQAAADLQLAVQMWQSTLNLCGVPRNEVLAAIMDHPRR